MAKNKGNAKIKDLPAFLEWYRGLSIDDAEKVYNDLKKAMDTENIPEMRNKYFPWQSENVDMFRVICWASYPPEETKEAKWPKQRAEKADAIERFMRYAIEFEHPLYVGEWVKDLFAFLYMGNPEQGVLIPYPERFLEFVPVVDYSGLTPGKVREALGAPRAGNAKSLVPEEVDAQLTTQALTSQLDAHRSAIAEKEQEIEATKKHQTKELAALQAQIDTLMAELEQKKADALAELDRKKTEMEEKLEQMESQIFILDSQIYAIRCFAGETVHFTRIRSGRRAPDTEPIIVHQKLRFLDEDLGRLASLYEIQWENIGMFEEFLKHSPHALDTFAPNDRCIQLVRLSRTGVQQGRDARYPYDNVMRNFKYYHGGTVGIIIRNGENLYLGWTEEDRVHIEDDLIFSNFVTDIRPAEPREFLFESERKRYKQSQREEHRRILDAVVSRAFVYNILQGVVEHSDMLPLPHGVTLGKQSQYVRYAVADKWLRDTRFGSFTDIIEQGNQRVLAGDMVLTAQTITPERKENTWDQSWHNSRGRGDRNLTHDCRAEDCTIYPVNLVEYDPPVQMVRYQTPIYDPISGKTRTHSGVIKKAQVGNLSKDSTILEEYERVDRHVFVSLRKEGEYRLYSGDARANVELYDGEYINLTYLNSVWLEWVVNTKTLGGWTVHGLPVDYAYAIRYIKTALDHVRKREEQEKAEIDAVDQSVCKDTDWPLKLSEWKLEMRVRKLTPYQAKRFVKAVLGKKQKEQAGNV